MTRTLSVYADNPLELEVMLDDTDPATGRLVALTSGVVTAFWSTTRTSAATAIVGAPTTTLTHIAAGRWRLPFTAVQLVYGTVHALFNGLPALYLIIVKASGLRVYIPFTYAAEKPALLKY